jgi:hypothetical protein
MTTAGTPWDVDGTHMDCGDGPTHPNLATAAGGAATRGLPAIYHDGSYKRGKTHGLVIRCPDLSSQDKGWRFGSHDMMGTY